MREQRGGEKEGGSREIREGHTHTANTKHNTPNNTLNTPPHKAAKKLGKQQDAVREGVSQLEALLPGCVNLHRMGARDWALLASDVNGVASKLICLKTLYPKADAFAMATARPKTLLRSEAELSRDAAEVKRMLSGAPDVDAIVEAVPELSEAPQLAKSLSWLRSAFPGQDAVALLQENPLILKNIGESNVEDSAEYGEMTTSELLLFRSFALFCFGL